MTHQEAFDEINKIQDEYIDELIALMNNPAYDSMKMLNFTSPTGTGKTKMMSKLIKKYSKFEYYFIITTLSKGQLHIQIRNNLAKDLVDYDNYYVYGSADFRVNSKLDAETLIGRIPKGSKCIWLRDEGHIRTNKWDEVLLDVCYKVINFSATNTHSDIQCNFTSTMMLRTVNQTNGTPEDAINKLIEIKNAHKQVSNYNPCAIFRLVSGDNNLYDMIINLCNKNHLKYIDITEDEYVMQQLCEDNSEYDVIINKFKIVEGIDIRRAHVLYMDNQPGNNSTTIQVIGRCRRNALLYRDDIDILDSKNKKLLDATRECYVYYNVEKMKIDEDENGELQYAFCNHISCQALKPNNIIEVKDGQLSNGLYIIELEGYTGKYEIKIDESTGFNTVLPQTDFYNQDIKQCNNCIFINYANDLYKLDTKWLKSTPIRNKTRIFDYSIGKYKYVKVEPGKEYIYIRDALGEYKHNYLYQLSEEYKIECKKLLDNYITNVSTIYKSTDEVYDELENIYIPGTNMTINTLDKTLFLNEITSFIAKNKDEQEYKMLCKSISTNKNNKKRDNFLWLITSHMRIYTNDYSWSYGWDEDDFKIANEQQIKEYIAIWLYKYINKDKYYDTNYNTILKYYYLFFLNEYCNTDYSNNDIIDELILSSDYIVNNELNDHTIIRIFNELLNQHEKYSDFSKSYLIICKDKEYLIQRDIKLANDIYNILVSGFIIPKEIFVLYDKTRLELVTEDIKRYVQSYSKDNILSVKDIDDLTKYKEYTKIFNDCESAIIGTDLMKPIKDDNDEIIWIESKSVSSKIGNYNKFNSFISNHYKEELDICKDQLYKGKNNFKLPTRCNSVIGYCVEYYSKYLIYGKDSLKYYIQMTCKESKIQYEDNMKLSDMLIIRACMLQYRENMIRCFGSGVSKVIKTISVSQMIRDEYKEFVNLVVDLGKQTAKFVKDQLYKNGVVNNIDPNLSINHITGLADYITEDTILDVKVRGCIGESEVRQVLAYHYLSTKRSDLNIKRVIVYDATSNRHVSIDITPENWKENQPYGYKG